MINPLAHWRSPELGGRGILKPGKLLWLRSLVWLVCFTFLLVVSFGPLSEAMSGLVPNENLAFQFAVKCFGVAVALCIYILLVRLVEQRPVSELDFRPAVTELSAGLLLGMLMFAFVMAILVGSGLSTFTINGPSPAWEAAGAALQAGVVEELIIRGVILRLLWRAFGPAIAFVGSALLFGAGHLPNPESSLFAAVCIALEAGVMLGAFYALTGRLWISIGVHVAWNFTQGFIFGAAVSGTDIGASLATSKAVPQHPQWLTGGTFGPEASLAALLVCSLVGAFALWGAWKLGRFARPPGPPLAPTSAVPLAATR